MKKSALFLIALTFFAPAVLSAQDTRDTTVRFNGKTIYVHDSIGRMKVSVMDGDSGSYRKVYEGIFADEKSYERFNVTQEVGMYIPILKNKYRHRDGCRAGRRSMEPHWAGFGVGRLTTADNNMNIGYTAGIPLNKGKSNEVMLNILEGILPIGGTTFGITSGFGLNWRSYHIEQNKHLLVKDAVTGVYDAPAGVTYRYSRMRTLHLTVPLMIEFQPTMWRRHNFFLTAGVVGGWNVMNTYRVMYDDPSKGRVNMVESRGLQTNPLTLDIMVQVGYSCIGFYAKYSPVGVFQRGKGADVHAASIGCMLHF